MLIMTNLEGSVFSRCQGLSSAVVDAILTDLPWTVSNEDSFAARTAL